MNDTPDPRRETAAGTPPSSPLRTRERNHAMPDSPHSDADPEIGIEGAAEYRRAFAVADALATHGSDCVCPRCAGRLPGLLAELARAVDAATVR